jgi:outer membrane protein
MAFTFEASLEHFIPLIPNIKFAQSSVSGDDLEYTKQDFTLYYEFLDNDIASFDAGVGLSKYSDARVKAGGFWFDFDGYLPHVYVATEIGIVGTPLFLFGKGSGIAYGNNHMYDASFGVQYEIPMIAFDLEFQGGYRVQRLDVSEFNVDPINAEIDGLFAGVNIDF